MKKLFYILSFLVPLNIAAQNTVGFLQNDSLALNGYTLIAPESSTTYLIDNCGYVVHSWEAEQRPGSSVYLLENGNLLRTGFLLSNTFNAGGLGGRIELFSWEGELLWRYDYFSPGRQQHHDVELLPNGNILLIAWDFYTKQNAVSNGRDPALTPESGVWSEEIIELEPVGIDDANIVWRWKLWDHLIQDFDFNQDNFGIVENHPELVDVNFEANAGGGTSSGADWIHLNSIDYNPELDQIIVSSRHFNEFWIIDHSTTIEEAASHSGGNSGMGGDLLYRWGNPAAYQRGSASDQKSFGQHDVQWVEEGLDDAGKIMFFNNGWQRPGPVGFSSIDIIEPPLNSDGTYDLFSNISPYEPQTPSYSFTSDPPEDFFSFNISGVQRLPNGNTLICNGRLGHIFEITADEQMVWQYQNPVRFNVGPVSQGTDPNSIPLVLFRAYKYATNYPAFDNKDLTPGDPIENNPLTYDCSIFDNPSTSISTLQQLEGIDLLGNPIRDLLKIRNDTGDEVIVNIFDQHGRMIKQLQSRDNLIETDVSEVIPGVYFIEVTNIDRSKSYKNKLLKLFH